MGRLLKEVHVLHRYPFLREHALEGRRRAFPAEDPSRLGVDLPVDPEVWHFASSEAAITRAFLYYV